MKRTKKRSLLKAITYRIICSTETFLITWLVSGSWEVGGGVALFLFFLKIPTYFGHERVWEGVSWGKPKLK